jgi:ribokinase
MGDLDVVVFGSCFVDFISYCPRLPKAGETLHSSNFETGYGGKGANQCVQAARLGSKTAMISKLGDDVWGRDYLAHLKAEGVNVDHLEIAEGINTGVAQINVAENGENQIVITIGANKKISKEDVDKCKGMLTNAKVLICQLEIPLPPTAKILEYFEGISIMNAAPAVRTLPRDILVPPTIFCVNETEAAIITGTEVDDLKGAKEAIFKLKEMGCKHVIVTLGKNGAIYSENDSDQVKHVKCPKVQNAVDTTGAGDSFIGALGHFLAKYGTTIDLSQIIGAANEIASLSVQRNGTQSSYFRKEDIGEDLLCLEKRQFEWELI